MRDKFDDIPVFGNTGICWACGKTTHVNAFGFCEDCWVTFAHTRRTARREAREARLQNALGWGIAIASLYFLIRLFILLNI